MPRWRRLDLPRLSYGRMLGPTDGLRLDPTGREDESTVILLGRDTEAPKDAPLDRASAAIRCRTPGGACEYVPHAVVALGTLAR